jgi:hypothetical protein
MRGFAQEVHLRENANPVVTGKAGALGKWFTHRARAFALVPAPGSTK